MGLSPIALTVVAGFLVVLGAALGLFGVRDLRLLTREGSAPVDARVTAHRPVDVEMITGSRGAKSTVSLVEVSLDAAADGTSKTATLRRAPDVAAREFPIGAVRAIFIDTDGRASTEAPSSTLGTVAVGGGVVLALVGLLLFILRKTFV
jgi:hypothetical protein